MSSVDIGRPPRHAVEKPGLLGQIEPSLLQEDEPMEKYSEALIGFDRRNKKRAVAIAHAGDEGEIRRGRSMTFAV